jgi:hypothetical protein
LLLAFIGHGHFAEGDEDFYFLPRDASDPPDSDTAIHLVQLIKERLKRHSVDGLVVLLDACYSGVAAQDAAARWGKLQFPVRFEMLTAAADRPAADGCFTRNLVSALRVGLSQLHGETIRCEDARDLIRGRCPNQEPRHPTLDADKGLYLARNVARYSRIEQEPWARTESAAEVERLSANYQPVSQLVSIVQMSEAARCVALVGDTGSGKSALTAALARPDAAEGAVPRGFVHAVFFISERTTPPEFALGVAAQLRRSLPLFRECQEAFKRSVPLQDFERLETIERELLTPLRLWSGDQPARIVVDALDRVSTGAQASIFACLEPLATSPDFAHVRLVLTSRPDTPLPTGARCLTMGAAQEVSIKAYLGRRGVAISNQPGIIGRANGNWLIAQTLADLALIDPAFDPDGPSEGLASAYSIRLREAGAIDSRRWRTELRPVLGVLAAAGVGPVLPLPLLRAASEKLGGPSNMTRLRDVLVDLRGMVVRGAPGTSEEQAGLFHQTFAEYLLNPGQTFGMDPEEPDRALVESIAALAPRSKHNPNDYLHRYAMDREPEHLWRLGRNDEAIEALSARESPVPKENLVRWRSWLQRIVETLGPDHYTALSTRAQVAHWTGEAGNPAEGLRLFEALLRDRMRVLGVDDRATLHTRNDIAHWIGQTGQHRESLKLFRALLKDQTRVLGPDDRDTLHTRNNIAHRTGAAGKGKNALRLFQALLKDQERALGVREPDTLHTRNNVAHWTGKTGDGHEALRLFWALLADQREALGPDHPAVLHTRHNIAHWTASTGDVKEGLRLFDELVNDQNLASSADNPRTLFARTEIALWTAGLGTAAPWTVLELFRRLVPDLERVLGPNHPETHKARSQMIRWQSQADDWSRQQSAMVSG